MKKILLLIAVILLLTFDTSGQSPTPRILGVVMGISKYQNVPSLRYADRDAMSFYNFLLSDAGGKADTNNIRLLLNEKATSYNFFEAMDNLLDMAKEGDQVYIYFAGHGDIEKKTERQNGFLIGYNAPPNCYAAGGSISVRFLQDYVETLVSKNKSKVTMIIDACRSGKLAGGSQGAEITALALQAEWKGVTKILSCQPGETSLEGEQWGGGAGVFTYFMLKGMLGQADNNGDGKVTAMELGTYLDKIVMQETHEKQIPEIVGDKRQEITRIDKKHALALLNQMERPISLPMEKQSAGFEADVSSINDISILKEYEKFKYYINNNNLIAYNDEAKDKENALSIFHSLEGRRIALPIISKMKGELVAALQNKAQVIMNGWVNNVHLTNVEIFDSTFKELRTVLSLIDTAYVQYKEIKYRYLFFKYCVEEDENEKFRILQECLNTNLDGPSVNYEIGFIYMEQKNYEKALYHYNRAVELSKNWAWPICGIGCVYNKMGKYEEAIKCFDKALEINPVYTDAFADKGNSFYLLQKFEESLKWFDKAIELKPDHLVAWSNKGYVLGSLGKYEEAIKCFDEAIKIYPDWIDAWCFKGNALASLGKNEDAIKCLDKAFEINPQSYQAWLSKGIVVHLNQKKYDEAIICYKKVLELNPNEVLANFNLSCAYSLIKNKAEMLKYLKKAIELDKKYKTDAPKDEDFKEYLSDPEFMELVK